MSTEQIFQNDDFTVEVIKKPGCNVRFNITASPAAALKSFNNALKSVGKGITVPGFRKGKAPADRILERYSSQVERKWQDELFNSAFHDAVNLSHTYPYSEKSIKNGKIESLSKDTGATVWVEFESLPEVPDVDPSTLKIELIEPEEVDPKEIDQVIEDFRFQHTEWCEVSGRPVAEGDFVDIDIENLDTPGNFLCKDTRLEIAEGKLGNWLKEMLIGMNKGDSKEGISEKDDTSDSIHFTPTKCKVTIKDIQQGKLPDINDDLAKKMGVETVDELMTRIRENLTKNKERDAQERKRWAVRHAVTQSYPFQVPESIVQDQTQKILSQRGRKLLDKAKEDEQALEELRALEQQIRRDIEEIVRWQFLVHKISKELEIQPSQEELLHEVLKMSFLEQDSLGAEDTKRALYEKAINKIMADKTADYLLDQSTEA